MKNIIAICGMAGSGKSEVRKYFETFDYQYVHFGSTEETIRRHGFTNESLEREIRNEMRQKHGMAAMAILALPKIRELLTEGKKVVIDNMYSWSEYKVLLEEFGEEFTTIAVIASPKVRYARLAVRPERPLNTDEARSRDYSEIEELEKGGPIAMADFTVLNQSDDISKLHNELSKLEL